MLTNCYVGGGRMKKSSKKQIKYQKVVDKTANA
jgi:hypothetical protein